MYPERAGNFVPLSTMSQSLPPELWRTILRFATSDGIDYELGIIPGDPSITRIERYSAVIKKMSSVRMTHRTKIDITQVSRLFNQVAAEFLYEQVRIDGASGATKLFKRLSDTSAGGPRQWIKVIVVQNDSGRPPPAKSHIAAQMVTDILRLCVDLRGFFWFHRNFFTGQKSSEEMITHIPGNIRVFRWSTTGECATLTGFLHKASTSLRVLVITDSIFCRCATHSPITFPLLTHLTLGGGGGLTSFLRSLGPMPSLTEFTLCGLNPNIIAGTSAPVWTRTLRIVRMNHEIRVFPTSNTVVPVLRACPILQEIHYWCHTRLSTQPSSPWTSDLNHPSLQYISVTGMGTTDVYRDLQHARSSLCLYFRNISASRFPVLDTIVVYDIILEEPGSGIYPICVMLRRVSDDFSSAELSVI
ncbi:hypothetical protein BD410DRAFT_622432 [Rickenella mellea]|uniref:F-box domain-containing protein n=1 Tax=Rickenella mellea TaxID=50990 RepID=A0A4Y7PNS4_9AGAM|nr:hypothetical protein BD410DRAFT_622432 [Rickenella mellea]